MGLLQSHYIQVIDYQYRLNRSQSYREALENYMKSPD